jgi:hypothetical protein
VPSNQRNLWLIDVSRPSVQFLFTKTLSLTNGNAGKGFQVVTSVVLRRALWSGPDNADGSHLPPQACTITNPSHSTIRPPQLPSILPLPSHVAFCKYAAQCYSDRAEMSILHDGCRFLFTSQGRLDSVLCFSFCLRSINPQKSTKVQASILLHSCWRLTDRKDCRAADKFSWRHISVRDRFHCHS